MPGTASSGGVSFGAGSVMTLTPQDADAISERMPRGTRRRSHRACPHSGGLRQPQLGPCTCTGPPPNFLDVREWTLAEGEAFTDGMCATAARYASWARRLVKELFQGESPIGKEVRVNNVPFKVIGVLAVKGANMMGMDQDDILLAPWTTIKYRVTGSSLANVNQSAGPARRPVQGRGEHAQSDLSECSASLYPLPSATQAANTPRRCGLPTSIRFWLRRRSSEQSAAAIKQITQLLRERHRIRPR